jgi:hypothetical protein
MEQIQISEISFNKFRELTYHKRVYFYFKKYADGTVKEFHTDKFYCNKYKGILSLPKFILSDTAKFYSINSDTFKAVSEFGETVFEIMENEH